MCVIYSKSCYMNVVWFASGVVTFEHCVTCDLIHVSHLNLKNCVMLKKWIVQEVGKYDVFISTIFDVITSLVSGCIVGVG